MAKKSKVKGYGAYWKGDVRNKTIARKNKQYISDQRCLRIYKKQIKELSQSSVDHKQRPNFTKNTNKDFFSDPDGASAIAEQNVKVIKPKIETVYFIPGAHSRAKETDIDDDDADIEDSKDKSKSTDVTDSIDASGHINADVDHVASDESLDEQEDYQGTDSDSSSKDDELDESAHRGSRREESDQRGNLKNNKSDKRTRKDLQSGENQQERNGAPDGKQKKKFTGVYAKALKLREERAKIRAQQHNEKVEKIKQKKREIREKKQERYERHRLLGKKTKKGQPIMSRVISHLMNNYQKKHEL
ncbi:uncharacterized protein BXIN_0355 [Babesia sp. Xinjiang]|uniref:uncharacterized protein n=1 Tax=Babesia sp. Xinjiang TaxID=462227 RepID=UPI000A24CB24|nr:uncharacterized protein BXIN_0355 [Babesia sp. Xinjiang]ORM41194.1 hypothetical protein BXIN_0355 [Babesia sp. Xinjiang]